MWCVIFQEGWLVCFLLAHKNCIFITSVFYRLLIAFLILLSFFFIFLIFVEYS